MALLTILDGGMGGELQRRGIGSSDGIWSAKALIDHPEMVADIHSEYINAGASVIITNSYSTIPSYLGKEGKQDQYLELTATAARIARNVADAASKEVYVAGTLPPLNESYRFDLVPSNEESAPIYASLTEALDPFVDLFVCETMSCVREAVNAVGTARTIVGTTKPIWVSWTLDEKLGGGLRSGESIETAYNALTEFAPDAFLFNCTDPYAISAALAELVKLTDKPIGAYPNRFHVPKGWTLDNEIKAEGQQMTDAEFVAFAHEWRAIGASIIGGCCGIGPEFIGALSKSVA